MKTILFALLISFSITVSGHESIDYQLLYHQGAGKEAMSGSIDNLIKAIRDGKQIRLYMNLGFVEHSMDAGFLSIFEGEVYAQIDPIQGQRPNKKTQNIELKPYTKHVGMYSTKSPYEIKWFAF